MNLPTTPAFFNFQHEFCVCQRRWWRDVTPPLSLYTHAHGWYDPANWALVYATTVEQLHYTSWYLATTCYKKSISGCVRMAYDSLLTTSFFQVAKRLCCKLTIQTCCQQTCYNLFQQVVTSLQIESLRCDVFVNTDVYRKWIMPL